MSDIAIRVEHLSKRYRLGQREQAAYRTLREAVSDVLLSPLRRFRTAAQRANGPTCQRENGYIWALRDVSFEVKRGEVVGIIGRNGAGKTTLLKILSRITEPTEGYAEIHGRVGSLLEVGTGFHPELTGRENIYLNGAILGMKKREIDCRFDEIVSFAEIGKFLDTPVKHYSSGMYVRLAFALAAHLEPEILLVDEVLAVGDARFWSKSINKMRALNQQGMTIVLVTHNMWLVQTLCQYALLLESGRVVSIGEPLRVIGAYKGLAGTSSPGESMIDTSASVVEPARDLVRIVDFEIAPQGAWARSKEALPYSGVKISMGAVSEESKQVRFLIRVTTIDNLPLFTVYSDSVEMRAGRRVLCEASIPHLMLMPGEYRLWGAVCSLEGEREIFAAEALPLRVTTEGSEAHTKVSLFWNRATWHIKEEGRK
ncbi:MAG: ABC transporter ATP-binding protein [Candidatus Methanomethyliaceae archaeon]|uniref:ABC transporter ATP-binding protein n=1 Tax=Candidatus Hadarchaeum sp. TaxID=2883567 RepID=UPI00317891BD